MAQTGTIFASFYNSGNYSGRLQYIGSYELRSQDPVTNKSVIRLYGTVNDVNPDNPSGYGSDDSTFKVNDVTVKSGSYRFYYGYTQLGYTDITVTHNANGSFPSQTISIYADSYHFNNQSASGTISNIPALDRAAPVISTSLASKTADSLKISVTASGICDIWYYSLDSGSTWTQFSTTEGTGVTCDITGLSPSVAYDVIVKARKKINHLEGTSPSASYSTLGAATLNSATEVYADASTVTLSVNYEVYNASYTYALAVKRDSTTILTLNIAAQSLGVRNTNITLTSAQRSSLLSGMSDVASFNATYVLTSYDNGTEVGSTSTTAVIRTSSATSGPATPTFSYADTNASTIAVTGDSSKLIQGQSILGLTSLSATAKNGASIASYNITCGGVTVTSVGGGTVSVGAIPQSGTLALQVVAKDTRGYTSTASVNVTCYAYSLPSLDTGTVKRDDIYNTHIALVFSGTYTDVGSNTAYAKYKYKKTSDANYSADVSISPTASSGAFSYSNTNVVQLDADYSYNFALTVSDKLNSETYYFVVSPYEPLIAYREGQLGINRVPRSGYAVDINGKVGLGGVDIPDSTKGGKYLRMKSDGSALEYGDSITPSEVVDLIYPVGSIYMSVNSTSPESLFGGTWVQLEDRFLLGAGSTYTNGDTGGAASHTITWDNIPSHSHTGKYINGDGANSGSVRELRVWSASGDGTDTITNSVGKASPNAISNLPPYLVVYMWKRTV